MHKIERFATRMQWLERREQGIGGSAVGTILGLSDFETPWQYWARRTGKIERQPESFIMKLGHLLEPVVVDLFAEATHAQIDEGTAADFIVTNDAYPYALASPDRLATLEDGTEVVLECKTTRKMVDGDSLPWSWFCQLQFYLMVTEREQGAIAWLINGTNFDYRFFNRDEAFCEFMDKRLREFVEVNLEQGVEPPLLPSDAAAKWLQSREGESVELSETAYMAGQELVGIKEQMAELERQADDFRAIIQQEMGDAETAMYKGQKVATWKSSKAGETFDSKAFKAAYPDLYGSFLKEKKAARPFLLKL